MFSLSFDGLQDISIGWKKALLSAFASDILFGVGASKEVIVCNLLDKSADDQQVFQETKRACVKHSACSKEGTGLCALLQSQNMSMPTMYCDALHSELRAYCDLQCGNLEAILHGMLATIVEVCSSQDLLVQPGAWDAAVSALSATDLSSLSTAVAELCGAIGSPVLVLLSKCLLTDASGGASCLLGIPFVGTY